MSKITTVAPRAGAWIETMLPPPLGTSPASPPARGRGLKLNRRFLRRRLCPVAPRAGAWIETEETYGVEKKGRGRPPRGGVD